jgi:hypothetical protein
MSTSDRSPGLGQAVKASALKRLGKPLLTAYLLVAVLAALGILASLGWAWFGL